MNISKTVSQSGGNISMMGVF